MQMYEPAGNLWTALSSAESLWAMETMRSIREKLSIIVGVSELLSDESTRDDMLMESGLDMIARHSLGLKALVDELELLAVPHSPGT